MILIYKDEDVLVYSTPKIFRDNTGVCGLIMSPTNSIYFSPPYLSVCKVAKELPKGKYITYCPYLFETPKIYDIINDEGEFEHEGIGEEDFKKLRENLLDIIMHEVWEGIC